MSVRIVACLNPASTEKTFSNVETGSIKDIISKLNSGFPPAQARVCLNGEIIKDFSLEAKDGDELSIKFIPHGDTQSAGAGMKIGGWAMAFAGLVIAGVFGWTGIGAFAGAALIGTGLGMALSGTVLLNTNIPNLKDREKPEQDPSVRGAKNQARPHGRVPVLFGRHRIYPDVAANSYTSIIDGKQYFTQLFCGGYKDYVIDINTFKLGETSIVDLSETKNISSILSGADPVIQIEIMQDGEESEVYPYCVHEDSVNGELKNKDEDGNLIEIIRTTPDNTESINVDIFFFNGLGKYNDKGDLEAARVEVKVSCKEADNDSAPFELLGSFTSGGNVITGAELKTKRFVVEKKVPKGKYTVKIERVTPDSADSKIIDEVYVGSIRSMKNSPPIRAERRKDLTVIAMRVLATSKLNNILDSFNYIAASKLPVYSGGGSGSLAWSTAAETRNPASMLLYALQGRAAQQKVDNNDIDWTSLEAFYLWCEEHNYTCNAYMAESVTIAELLKMIGATSRAEILRVDSKIAVVQDIERPSHMQLFTPKNSAGYSVTMFNADIPDSIALRFIDEEKDGFASNELSVYNTQDGNRVKEPESTQKTDLWGITNSEQARRIGMYNYACLKNRPFVHTIETDIEYLVVNKGDWIQYAGDIALMGSMQGRIKGVIWADGVVIGIDTDEPVVMEQGKQYAVRIRRYDGAVILKDIVYSPGKLRRHALEYFPGQGNGLYDPMLDGIRAVGEDNVYYEPENVILFTEPVTEAEAPRAGDIYAAGVRGYEALDLIITDIQPGQNFTATLTCVEYSPEIFAVDKPGFVLPDFVNRVTPVSGAVDSGVVNSSNFRLFAVYNDSDAEPPRPTGDGQADGWHYVQTFRSVWQSTKMAEAVDSGEWGAPVRIRAAHGTEDLTPVWLSIEPKTKLLGSDAEGNILAGLLPFTVQARLMKWTEVLQAAAFSLVSPPSGVSINSNGVITVAAGAALGDETVIAVRAEYQGAVYTAALTVTKETNSSAPRYLGTAKEITLNSANVTILKGPVMGRVGARQGDYVLAVKVVGVQSAGRVFQWTGVAWEFRSPDTHTDLYMRCVNDGLEDPGLASDMEWFGAVFARLFIAQRASIDELSAQVLSLKKLGEIKSEEKFSENEPMFSLKANGETVFNNAVVRGKVYASEGEFTGTINATDGKFSGTINAKSGTIGGQVLERIARVPSASSNDYPVQSILVARAYDSLPVGAQGKLWAHSQTGSYRFNPSTVNQAGSTLVGGKWQTLGTIVTGVNPTSYYVLLFRVE